MPRRRLLRVAVACALAIAVPLSGTLGSAIPASHGDDHSPFALPALPADPVDAVTALAELVHGQDAAVAVEAAGELLRRAGIPIVAPDGAVVALPDGAILGDEAVYEPFLAQLSSATRRGDFYTPRQVAELLTVLGVTAAPIPADTLLGGLGAWGKRSDDGIESRVAGAGVRALAGIRLEVLYPKADPATIHLDPLQVVLVLAHALSDAYVRADATGATGGDLRALLGVGTARAAAGPTGPCDRLAEAMKTDDKTVGGAIEGQLRDKYKEALIDSWKEFALSEKARQALEKGTPVYEKGSAVLNTLLLLMGATIDLSDDRGGITHYRHDAGDRETDVHVTARARFDSTIAKDKIACYGLAGIEVPPPGPLEGFRIRWYLDQPVGRGYAGKHVAPVRADSTKFLATGGGGEVTGRDGTSKVTLETAVERNPGKGTELEGHVTVTASLDKDDFPFKLSDAFSLGPGFAKKKIWDLLVSAVQKAGLPSQRRVIKVAYHGTNIYAVKGETTLFAFYYLMPIYLDIYTCEGIDGRWQGVGGFRADQTFFGDAANQVFGTDMPKDFTGRQQLDFIPLIRNGLGRFDIVPGSFHAIMSFDQGRQYWQQDYKPVGEVEVLIQGTSVDPLAIFDGRGARWPIVQLPEHPHCPEGGAYFP